MLIVIGLKSKPALLIIELHTVPKKNPNFISMMSMQCMPMEQKNMICRKIFLPYDITPVSMNKSSFLLYIPTTSLLWKKIKKNVYRIP